RSMRCKRLHTPACCQSRSRLQQVMPLPQPSSCRNSSHGMPLLKTNTMPVSAARSVMVRSRPPLGLGRSGGKRGAMISQSVSLINGVLMPLIYHRAEVMLGALRACPSRDTLAKVFATCIAGGGAPGLVGAGVQHALLLDVPSWWRGRLAGG